MVIQMNRKYLVAAFVVVILAGVSWYVWQEATRPLTLVERLWTAPLEINRSLTPNYELKINESDFSVGTHVVTIGDKIKLTGVIDISEKQIHSEAFVHVGFYIVLRPRGTSDRMWRTIDVPYLYFLREPSRSTVNTVNKVSPKRFKPGEYDMRLFMQIDAMETDIQFVHLLDKGKITILPDSVANAF